MTGICAVVLSFSLFVLTHWAICRYFRWRPLSQVLNVTWLCFLPVYVIIFFLLRQTVTALAVDLTTVDGVANFINGLLFNLFFLVGYTVFFFLIERGLSLRVMIEIHRSPHGRMTIEEIMTVYTYDYILEKRLGQMLKMGYAVRKDGYLRSTERAARLIGANRLVRKIFRIKQVMP
jgi:hypothetical protein